MLERAARALLLRSGSRAELCVEKRFPGKRLVGGKYHMATHTITLYLDEIQKQCVQLFGSAERLEEYVSIVFAHELGHAEDAELDGLAASLDGRPSVQEKKRIALRIEENAWDYAKTLLAEADAAFVDMIIEESLAAYRADMEPEIA